jgi:hypothetical protein
MRSFRDQVHRKARRKGVWFSRPVIASGIGGAVQTEIGAYHVRSHLYVELPCQNFGDWSGGNAGDITRVA